MNRLLHSPKLEYIAKLAVLVVAYWAAGKIGLSLATVESQVTLVWAPSGIALAILLLFGPKMWPGIYLGTILVNIDKLVTPFFLLVGAPLGNTLAAVTGAFFLKRFTDFNPKLHRAVDVFNLLLWGAIVSTVIAASWGSLSLYLSGMITSDTLFSAWWTWWLGDAMGVVLVTPLILSWYLTRPTTITRTRVAEMAVLLGATIIVSRLLFDETMQSNAAFFPLAYLIFPLLIWSAFRFGQPGAMLVSLLAISLAVWGVIRGVGPFVQPVLQESLLLVWLFMGIVSITATFLAAIIKEREHAQSQLAKERDFALLVMNTLGQGVAVSRLRDQTYEYVNPAMARMLGYTPQEIINKKNPLDAIMPEDVPILQKALADREKGKLSTYELRLRHKDGSALHALLTGTPMVENGVITGSVVVVTDLTDRKKAEQALTESEARNRALLEALPDVIFLQDNRGVFIDLHTPGDQKLTIDPAEILGRPMAQALPPELHTHFKPAFERVVNTGQPQVIEYPLHLNNQQSHFETRFVVCGTNQVLSIMRDITGRVQATTALRESEERFRQVIASITDHIYMAEIYPDGSYHNLFLSPPVEQLTGRSLHALMPDPDVWLSLIHPDDLPIAMAQLKQLQQGHDSETEYRITHTNKSIIWVRDSARIERKQNKIMVYGIISNITERKKLESQLAQSQKMEAIGRLAGGIAHDFNNILTVIIGNTELLLDLISPDEVIYRDLEQIRKVAKRAASLTRQLLTFSRQQALNPTLVDLNKIIADMEKMLHSLIGEDITLTTRYQPRLGVIKADLSQIEQVIMNLVVNARDAMPDGGTLHIETSRLELADDDPRRPPAAEAGSYVLLTVTDSGMGITDEVKAKIFEPFFTTKEQGKGTGLGLATIHGIVTQSGGHITVTSNSNRGTTFEVYLPLAKSEAPPDVPTLPAPKNRAGQATILLVEDEVAVRTVTCRTLKQRGYHVLEANSSRHAIELLQNSNLVPTLLITDVVMPGGMNGLQLARQLQAIEPTLTVLYISGYNDMLIEQVHRENLNFLQKPFSPRQLLEKVANIINNTPQPTQPIQSDKTS